MLLIGDIKFPGRLPDDFGNLRMVDEPDAAKQDIEVRQVSDKRIEIYSRDYRKLASHRPRGRLSRRIGIWELHDMLEANQWERDYSLSPDGYHLDCRILIRRKRSHSSRYPSTAAHPAHRMVPQIPARCGL